jgi:hypothetical protein
MRKLNANQIPLHSLYIVQVRLADRNDLPFLLDTYRYCDSTEVVQTSVLFGRNTRVARRLYDIQRRAEWLGFYILLVSFQKVVEV